MPSSKTKSTSKASKASKAKADKAKAAKAKARKDALASGALIEDGKREFARAEDGQPGAVEKRAAAVIKTLEASKVPVVGADLKKKHGGGWPQYLSMFAMLKTQGLVVEYRVRTGERGGSGVAYLHAKHAK